MLKNFLSNFNRKMTKISNRMCSNKVGMKAYPRKLDSKDDSSSRICDEANGTTHRILAECYVSTDSAVETRKMESPKRILYHMDPCRSFNRGNFNSGMDKVGMETHRRKLDCKDNSSSRICDEVYALFQSRWTARKRESPKRILYNMDPGRSVNRGNFNSVKTFYDKL